MTAFPPDQALVLRHTPEIHRPALEALLALDGRLAQILRSATSPMTGQLKLTWWRDALARLDAHPAPAEPILQGLAHHVVANGVRGVDLGAIAEGWMALLAEDYATAPLLDDYAGLRGGKLFAAAARAFGGVADDRVVEAGKAWALADLALHVSRAETVITIQACMVRAMTRAFTGKWNRSLRPIATLSLLSAFDLDGRSRVSSLLRLVKFRLTGR